MLESPIVAGAAPIEKVPQSQNVVTVNQVKTLNDIKNHWAEYSIRFLDERDNLHRMPDGSIKPDRNISREEAVKVLVETLAVEVNNQKSKIPYLPEGFWAEECINVAKDQRIVEGYPDGTFGFGNN